MENWKICWEISGAWFVRTRFYGSILYYLSVYWVYLCAGMKHLYVCTMEKTFSMSWNIFHWIECCEHAISIVLCVTFTRAHSCSYMPSYQYCSCSTNNFFQISALWPSFQVPQHLHCNIYWKHEKYKKSILVGVNVFVSSFPKWLMHSFAFVFVLENNFGMIFVENLKHQHVETN